MDTPTSSNRFEPALTESDLNNRMFDTLSQNTIRKSKWAMDVFEKWFRNRQNQGIINGLHVFKKLDEMSKSELNSQLKFFVFEVRKQTGERYPSTSLRDLIQGIGYHYGSVLQKGYRIFSDPEFKDTLGYLNAAMI